MSTKKIETAEAEATTEVEETTKLIAKRVKLRIDKVPGGDNSDVIIGFNGKNYIIPRGKEVEVPDYVKAEYDRSVKAQMAYYETEENLRQKAENSSAD
jgi:hypothetical protein